jgi:hypothetical protein
LICANRPFWGKKCQKSAIFRKCIRIFLPTFGFQKRAKAHFFWPKIGKFVRTSPENSSKNGQSPLSPKQNWAKFTPFFSLYGRIFATSKSGQSFYQSILSVPQSQSPPTRTSKTGYTAVYEIFHPLFQGF